MKDWNVVVTVHEQGFNQARRLLGKFGEVAATEFFNLLVMRVDDSRRLLEDLRKSIANEPDTFTFLARLVPVTQTFLFQTPEEFERMSCIAASAWLPALSRRSFHVRMHRRGFKGKLSSMNEERFLDEYLLDALETTGSPGHISFDNPDVIIALETVGTRAGLSLWTREEMQQYSFLRID